MGIVDVLDGRSFTVRNPFDHRAKVVLDIALPKLLIERRWQVHARSAGGTSFSLAPGAARRVRLAVTPGGDVSPAEVKASPARDVVVSVIADGIVIGGMTYRLDPDREKPMPQDGPSRHGDGTDDDCIGPAERLLRCLDLPDDHVSGVKLKKVSIDIDMDDC